MMPLTARRILLVGAHAETRKLMKRLIETGGHVVRDYPTGGSAETAGHLFYKDIDVAILDADDSNAPVFATHLLARCPGVNLILITAEFDVDCLRSAFPSVHAFVKPIDGAQLMNAIVET